MHLRCPHPSPAGWLFAYLSASVKMTLRQAVAGSFQRCWHLQQIERWFAIAGASLAPTLLPCRSQFVVADMLCVPRFRCRSFASCCPLSSVVVSGCAELIWPLYGNGGSDIITEVAVGADCHVTTGG